MTVFTYNGRLDEPTYDGPAGAVRGLAVEGAAHVCLRLLYRLLLQPLQHSQAHQLHDIGWRDVVLFAIFEH